MKKSLLFIFSMILSITGFSQEQTLLGNQRTPVGGFGGFHSHISLDQAGYRSGGGFGGVSFQDFFIGGFGMGTSSVASFTKEGVDYNQNLGMGGIMIGYVIPNEKIVHFFGQVKAGWGGYSLSDTETEVEVFSESIIAAVPEIGVELNVTRWFRIAVTAGYHMATGIEQNDYVTNRDLLFPVAGLTFRFGSFSSY